MSKLFAGLQNQAIPLEYRLQVMRELIEDAACDQGQLNNISKAILKLTGYKDLAMRLLSVRTEIVKQAIVAALVDINLDKNHAENAIVLSLHKEIAIEKPRFDNYIQHISADNIQQLTEESRKQIVQSMTVDTIINQLLQAMTFDVIQKQLKEAGGEGVGDAGDSLEIFINAFGSDDSFSSGDVFRQDLEGKSWSLDIDLANYVLSHSIYRRLVAHGDFKQPSHQKQLMSGDTLHCCKDRSLVFAYVKLKKQAQLIHGSRTELPVLIYLKNLLLNINKENSQNTVNELFRMFSTCSTGDKRFIAAAINSTDFLEDDAVTTPLLEVLKKDYFDLAERLLDYGAKIPESELLSGLLNKALEENDDNLQLKLIKNGFKAAYKQKKQLEEKLKRATETSNRIINQSNCSPTAAESAKKVIRLIKIATTIDLSDQQNNLFINNIVKLYSELLDDEMQQIIAKSLIHDEKTDLAKRLIFTNRLSHSSYFNSLQEIVTQSQKNENGKIINAAMTFLETECSSHYKHHLKDRGAIIKQAINCGKADIASELFMSYVCHRNFVDRELLLLAARSDDVTTYEKIVEKLTSQHPEKYNAIQLFKIIQDEFYYMLSFNYPSKGRESIDNLANCLIEQSKQDQEIANVFLKNFPNWLKELSNIRRTTTNRRIISEDAKLLAKIAGGLPQKHREAVAKVFCEFCVELTRTFFSEKLEIHDTFIAYATKEYNSVWLSALCELSESINAASHQKLIDELHDRLRAVDAQNSPELSKKVVMLKCLKILFTLGANLSKQSTLKYMQELIEKDFSNVTWQNILSLEQDQGKKVAVQWLLSENPENCPDEILRIAIDKKDPYVIKALFNLCKDNEQHMQITRSTLFAETGSLQDKLDDFLLTILQQEKYYLREKFRKTSINTTEISRFFLGARECTPYSVFWSSTLLAATENQQIDIIEKLNKRRPQRNCIESTSEAIIIAAKKGDELILDLLARTYSDSIDYERTDKEKKTALTHVIERKNQTLITKLIGLKRSTISNNEFNQLSILFFNLLAEENSNSSNDAAFKETLFHLLFKRSPDNIKTRFFDYLHIKTLEEVEIVDIDTIIFIVNQFDHYDTDQAFTMFTLFKQNSQLRQKKEELPISLRAAMLLSPHCVEQPDLFDQLLSTETLDKIKEQITPSQADNKEHILDGDYGRRIIKKIFYSKDNYR